MIELKYKSPQIRSLSLVDLLLQGKAMLLKIHVITGWSIPGDELMGILVDQFVKHLSEKYINLNIDEIEYAFRQHGTTTKDWGKSMNLNLVDTVLIPYTNNRFLLSQDEEKVKFIPPEQKIFTDEELDDSAREDAERQYQLFLQGYELQALETDRRILEKDGLIKPGENIIEMFKRRVEKQVLNIYIKEEKNGS